MPAVALCDVVVRSAVFVAKTLIADSQRRLTLRQVRHALLSFHTYGADL